MDHMITLLLVFKVTSVLFNIMATPIYVPTNSIRIPFSHPSPALIICRLFNDDHSDQFEVIPH